MKSTILLLLSALAACDFFTAPEDVALVPTIGSSRFATPASQFVVLTGRVSSTALDQGLEGANVRISALNVSVGTRSGGEYRITLPARLRGRDTPITVRAIGFRPQERIITLGIDTLNVDFSLAVDTTRLSEVVITALGADATYAKNVCQLSIVVVTTSSYRASTPPTQALPGRYRPMDNSEPSSQPLLGTGNSPLSKGIARTLFSKTG